jgi:transcription-repair coupling factor (superfamily II helicase)
MREGRTPALDRPLAAPSEVELHVPALLPGDYVPDVQLRLALYQRLGAATLAELADMNGELHDRFGPLPAQADNLLKVAALRLHAKALGLRRLDFGPQGGSIQFDARHSVDADAVIHLLRTEPRTYRMDGPSKLRIACALAQPAERIAFATALLVRLRPVPRTAALGAK